MYMEASIQMRGPRIPDVHLDEMSEDDLRNLMAYAYGAVRQATQDGTDNTPTQILIDWYDELVMRLAEISPDFVEGWRRGFITPPQGVQFRDSYLEKLGLLSES